MSPYAVIDPTTGRVVQEYPTITDAALDTALAEAVDAHAHWSRGADPAARGAVVRRVAELHRERREALAAIIVREMGKPFGQALGEVDFAAEIYEYYADHAAGLLADEPIELSAGTGTAVIRKAGIGVLLGVMPWNFPYYQVARFAGPNIVAGNTIVLKHAPQCPESAAAIAEIFDLAAAESGAPAGIYRNIYATNEQIAQVVGDRRIQGVSVTGSERAGSAVAELAGRHLKKVVLELGGSDPFILLSTDDLDAAVADAVAARLDNNGQSCNAAKRFIVIDDLYDEFAARITSKLAVVTVGNPLDEATELGPLSSAMAADRLDGQIERAVQQGATALLRGRREGNYLTPTVLADVPPDAEAYREEFFGPVAALYRVTSEDEAVAVANDTPFGLGAYVYTTDPGQAERIADALDVGMVWINLVLGDAAELPFGGTKRSGFGREMGRLAVDEFINRKLVRTAG
jgi:succinate-semialdehyde dehydrogenase/glutarate-semialdehyde dehydrogenase